MASFQEALKNGVKSAFCQVTNTEANLLELYRQIIPTARLFPNLPRFYNQLFCNKPPVPDGPYTPPGGQCSKVYLVGYTSHDEPQDGDGTVDRSAFVRVWGPISSFQYEDYAGVTNGKYTVTARGSGNNPSPSPTPVTIDVDRTIFGAVRNPKLTTTITSVTTLDGSLDNCGDSPNAPPAYIPGGNKISQPITYIDSNNNNITIPVVFAFGYVNIDPNFNFKIPVTLNLNGKLNVTANFNLTTGDINFNFGSAPGVQPSPPGDARPGDEPGDYAPDGNPPTPVNPPTPPKPPAPPDPSTELVIRAALVVTTSIVNSSDTVIGQTGGNPSIHAPNLGYINFYYRSGAFAGWSEDIPVKNVQTIIPVPWDAGAIDVKGTARKGVAFTITPIYKKVEMPASTPP